LAPPPSMVVAIVMMMTMMVVIVIRAPSHHLRGDTQGEALAPLVRRHHHRLRACNPSFFCFQALQIRARPENHTLLQIRDSANKLCYAQALTGNEQNEQQQAARPPPSPIKAPERCPHCASPRIAPKGSRRKKHETVRLYHCRACNRRFTPGPRALRGKTYPVAEILDAITAYNRGDSLEVVSRRLSSRYGHSISPSTISRWLASHQHLTTHRRLREKGRGLFSPPRLIRTVKLYHAQVYEFSYHRAKLAFLRDGSLDDRRDGDTRLAPLADFLESAPHSCPHELFRREEGARASKLPSGFPRLIA
jgi:hypothetical protein